VNRGDEDPVTDGLFDVAKEVFNEREDERDAPRDLFWVRWVKFASLILVLALLFGLGFLLADYVQQYGSHDYVQRTRAERRVEGDSIWSMKFRFVVGACIGGGLGAIYVIRCIVRKVDP
jgi:hypothetical protein